MQNHMAAPLCQTAYLFVCSPVSILLKYLSFTIICLGGKQRPNDSVDRGTPNTGRSLRSPLRALRSIPFLDADLHNLSRLYALKNFLDLWHQWLECFDSIVWRDENYYCHACIAQVLLVRQILIGSKKYIELALKQLK
jgi:hypothetical protein